MVKRNIKQTLSKNYKKPLVRRKVWQAKRSLGQNFLTSKAVVKKISTTGGVKRDDTVLEIGPGKGILTKELLARGATVIAFEKDSALYETLEEMFKKDIAENALILIHDDIFNFKKYQEALSPHLKKIFKIIANIPYNITGKLLPFFFELNPTPVRIVLLVQKEVALRIVARDKKESILSISVKAFGTPKYIKKVSARLFSPKPKVDSAILSISDISRHTFKDIKEEKFFRILKKGFSKKRKLLKNNLELDKDILRICGIKEMTRAEELTLDDWACITKHYE